MAPKVTPPDIRFDRQTVIGPVPTHRPDLGNCTLFTGATGGRYGRFSYNGRLGLAHRFAWEQVHGPIPDGLTIDHLCRVLNCVRVSHLEVVTQHENNVRAAKVRTHCKNGHEYTSDNTLYQASKGDARHCRKCRQACGRRSAEKVKIQKGLDPKVNLKVKYDQELKARLVAAVLAGTIQICDAAEMLGCTPHTMSTYVSRGRRKPITDTRMKAAMA